MSSLLPHDLCHGRSASLWPPTQKHQLFRTQLSSHRLIPTLFQISSYSDKVHGEHGVSHDALISVYALSASPIAQLVKNLPAVQETLV